MNRAGSVSKYATKAGERLWRYRFDADTVDGKRSQIGHAGFTTRAAAVKACGDAILDYERSKALVAPARPPKETLADWLRVWLRDYAPQNCTPGTCERYGQLAGYVLNATTPETVRLRDTPLAEVDHNTIEAALLELSRTPARRTDHLSPRYIRDIMRLLSTALSRAFRKDKIVVNPCMKVELPKVQKTEAASLTSAQMDALRRACAGEWLGTFIEVALASGARRGELLALEWPDVDYLNSVLHVKRSLEYTKALGLRVKRPKNNRVRKFHIGQSAITALRFHQEQQQEHRRLFGTDYKGDLVFCQADGSYFLPHLVSGMVIRRMRKAGITGASLHTTRHSHASHLLSNGVPLPVVSARLGHSSVNVTAEIYAHMLPDDDMRAADAWENVARGPVLVTKKLLVTSRDNGESEIAVNDGKKGSATKSVTL